MNLSGTCKLRLKLQFIPLVVLGSTPSSFRGFSLVHMVWGWGGSLVPRTVLKHNSEEMLPVVFKKEPKIAAFLAKY